MRTIQPLPRKIGEEANVRIVEHAFWMQKSGYSESTIRAAVKTLRHLARNCNLLNPESFLNYNATAKYGDATYWTTWPDSTNPTTFHSTGQGTGS